MTVTLVLMRTTIQAHVWLGEAAMAGATLRAAHLRVIRHNGQEEQGLVIPTDDPANLQRIVGLSFDEYDATRLHPLPSVELLVQLQAHKRRKAKQ